MGISIEEITQLNQLSKEALIVMYVEQRTLNTQWQMQFDRVVAERNRLMESFSKGQVQFPASKFGVPVIEGGQQKAPQQPQRPAAQQQPPQQRPPVTPAPQPAAPQKW